MVEHLYMGVHPVSLHILGHIFLQLFLHMIDLLVVNISSSLAHHVVHRELVVCILILF